MDCYWIVIATHVLNRLLQQAAVVQSSSSVAAAAAAAAAGSGPNHPSSSSSLLLQMMISHGVDALSTILLSDPQLLEKATHVAASRSILARAILTCTVAASHCLMEQQQQQQQSFLLLLDSSGAVPTNNSTSTSKECLKACVATLDRLVGLKKSSITTTTRTRMTELASSFAALDVSAAAEDAEDACIAYLIQHPTITTTSTSSSSGNQEALSTTPPPTPPPTRTPAKRKTRRKAGSSPPPAPSTTAATATTTSTSSGATASSGSTTGATANTPPPPLVDLEAWFHALNDLMESESYYYGPRVDGRVAIRRWASMALVWSSNSQQGDGHGQLMLLQVAHAIATSSSSSNTTTTTSSNTTATKKRKKKKEEEEEEDSSFMWTCSEKSEWMNILVQVVCEAGTHCGLRPPSGGMDQYLKAIRPKNNKTTNTSSGGTNTSTTTSTSPKGSPKGSGSSKKKVKPQRADIRDWAVVAIYDLLEVHKECLEQIATITTATKTTTGTLVINDHDTTVNDKDDDDDDENEDNDENDDEQEQRETNKESAPPPPPSSRVNGIFTAPDLVSTLTNLCRVAASSVPGAEYADQAEWTKALMGLTMACALRLVVDSSLRLPLDIKLTNFAMTRLANCMQALETQPSSNNNNNSNNNPMDATATTATTSLEHLDSTYNLTRPFPQPDIAMISTDYTNVKRDCSYAGLNQTIVFRSFTEEHAVGLVMRAIWDAAGGGGGTSATTPAAQFVTTLTNIVERMYDTRTEPSGSAAAVGGAEAELEETVTKTGKKRSIRGSSRSRQSKRLKTAAAAAAAATTQGPSTTGGDIVWRPMSVTRASVAKETLNVLKLCLLNQAYPQSLLRQSIREQLEPTHYLKLIELGEGLHRAVVKTKQPTKLEGDRFGAFSLAEKQLWTAHMGMCQYLGRGRPFDDSFMVNPILGSTTSQRRSIYQGLAKSHKSPDGMEWSLSLPAAHHALLAANLTSERKATARPFTIAEQYITNEYVKSIHHALRNIQTLTPAEWEDHYLYVDCDIPLSYNDARTFVLAFCRLVKDDQLACLEDLLTLTCNAIESIRSNEAKRSLLARSSEASGFVARVLVVCGCLIDIIMIGTRLEKAYFTNVGSRSHIKLPSHVTSMDWYRCERCFMGIFDWESSALPDSTLPSPSLNGLKDSTIAEFRATLEIGFELGFDSARQDKCHLLFAAWNGLDKIQGIRDGQDDSGSRVGTFPSLKLVSTGDYAARLLELREDVCTIYGEINQGSNSRLSPSRLKVNLRSMLSRANELLTQLLDEHAPEDGAMTQEIPNTVFAILEALPAYISACVAGHTKPGNDYFSSALAKGGVHRASRQRGYSSESEQALSDADSAGSEGGDYDTDTRTETLSRLRECCHAFGAAPIHPDWLDVSSSLRDSVRYPDALEVAEEALQMLKKLMATAYIQYRRHHAKALKGYSMTTGKKIEERISLCLNLCHWSNHEPADSSMLEHGQYQDDRDWKEDIAAVCDLPQEIVELFLEESCVKNLAQARESWCPNAAHRLVGKLQDRVLDGDGSWEASSAELRAGGEWELMLAQAVAVSCLDVKYGSSLLSDSARTDFSSRPGHEDMVAAQMWQSVLSNAVSHLMPAAALLRVGLGKGGRKPHPFCFHDKNLDPYDVDPLQFSEPLPNAVIASPSQKKTVLETISITSMIAAEGEDVLASQCHAVAAHLMVNTDSFSDLEGLNCIRSAVIGLKRIRKLADGCTKKDERLKIIPFIVEQLTSVVEEFSKTAASGLKSPHEFRRLVAFLGTADACKMDSIVYNGARALDILGLADDLGLDEEEGNIYWTQKDLSSVGINMFVSVLFEDTLGANDRTRACFAMLLRQATSLEFKPEPQSMENVPRVIVPGLIRAVNKISEKSLKAIVLHDFCSLTASMSITDDLPDGRFREDLGTLFCFLLLAPPGQRTLDRCRSVLDTLLGSFDSWSNLRAADREPILETLFLYGCRFNSLHEIGSKLVARVSSMCDADEEPTKTMGEVDLLTKLFGSVRDFRVALSASAEETRTRSALRRSSKRVPKKLLREKVGGASGDTALPRSCSYVQRSGFHSQHWYNCYTCGLVWDKGCCTLCALVCHKGHDVSYSRCSSFFCDCGAENSNAAEQNRVACKCLSPLSVEDAERILRTDENPLEAVSSNLEGGNVESSPSTIQFASAISIEIARESFKATAISSIQKFTESLKDAPWRDSLFKILRQQFQLWMQEKSVKSTVESLALDNGLEAGESQAIVRVPHISQRRILRSRAGKVLDIQSLTQKTLVSVRAAKGFEARMSSDSSAHPQMMSKLSRREISRSTLVADSRGRMILAEPCSLVFFSPTPAVCVRYVSMPYDSPLTRKQMCILGTASIKFNIVGLQLCTENERHLVVWGSAEASVVVLKPDWSGIEENIDLVFDVGQHDCDGDYLVKCEWIPGSQTNVVVGCSRFVRIYDVTRTKSDKRALPIIGYNLGFEACLRDVTIVPFKGYDHFDDRLDESSNISKMFLLLENGRLHVVDLKTGPSGRLESPGDKQHFEPSECILLSTGGVRIRAGSSVGHQTSSTRALGEGSRLAYLKQSRVLLYKCTSSCVLALMLDKRGDVEGTFEFLPHTIPSKHLGDVSDGNAVSGPYTHWTELGVAYRQGTAFFRVACVGRSLINNQPKLLCVEFNENELKIREVTWTTNPSMGLGLSMINSFEGVAAFSVPLLGDATSESSSYGERVFLSALCSNGTILFFGEELIDTSSSSESDGSGGSVKLIDISELEYETQRVKKPVFPLTLFERLKNIGETEMVVFGGDGIGR
eukprot:scaffold2535_cov126-Cylindrotheca_fusiformis.AAC.10